ncbi:hypothetical protein BH11ACT5_BH11ACT5_23210 [soil metagenome]
MSPTSTEGPAFRRALALTVGALVVLCGVFLALGYLQGPKLSSAQVDTTGVVEQGGQQVRLFANQAVAQVAPSQVSVTPATGFTVSTQGDIIAVQFDSRLNYATDYRVTVTGVTSVYLNQPSTIDYTFTTATPTLHYLDRGDTADDIVTTGLRGSDRAIIYSTPHIQDFAVLDEFLAVVTLNDDHTSSLSFVNTDTSVVEKVRLPDTGSISALDASAAGNTLGFTLTSSADGLGQKNNSTLYTIDLTAGRAANPVLGLDGKPIDVLGWEFLPGTGTLLALTFERSLLLIDPASGTVTPYGQFLSFDKVAPDGLSVTMTDTFGEVSLDLATGEVTRLEPSPVDGAKAFQGATATLPNGDRIQKVVVPDPTGRRFSSLLVYDDGTSARVLYQTPDDGGSISDFTVSPNGQYVAIETVPDASASVSDGYYLDARSTSVTTVLIDVESGAQTRSVEGFALCL